MGKTAVIVGGSIAGLMHGIMLKRHGYEVTVLEQDVSTVRRGYDAGIGLAADVLRFLEKHDRTGRKAGIPCKMTTFIDKDAKQTRNINFQVDRLMTGWGLLVSILRANFDGHVSVAVSKPPSNSENDGKAVFRHGARVTSLQDLGSKVLVQFNDMLSNTNETLTADIVIAADGSNSTIRKMLLPKDLRKYVGYVLWRGTVKEKFVPEEHRKVFESRIVIHNMKRNYFLVYTIPTDDGDLDPGERLLNWAWYVNVEEGSKDLSEIMTDIDGKTHYGTVPRGRLRPEIWEKMRSRGTSALPACMATLVEKTEIPFVTKIHESRGVQGVFWEEKVFLVGDGLVQMRPHIGLGTNQAAYDCALLEEVIEGNLSAKQWERSVLKYGNSNRMLSEVLGMYALGTKLIVLWTVIRYFLHFVGQKLGLAK